MPIHRIAVATAVFAAFSLAVAVVGYGRTNSVPTLTGTVGPGFTISLKAKGKAVKSLKAGSYKFVVTDKASIHGFTLEQEKGGTFREGSDGGAVHRHEDGDRQAQGRAVEVLLPAARVVDVRLLHRQVKDASARDPAQRPDLGRAACRIRLGSSPRAEPPEPAALGTPTARRRRTPSCQSARDLSWMRPVSDSQRAPVSRRAALRGISVPRRSGAD